MNDNEYLKYFEELKDSDIKKQINANEKIKQTLLSLCSQTNSDFKSSLGEKVFQDLDFTIQKLIKGSTSSELTIQTSYSIALGQILHTFQKEVDLQSFIDMVHNECNTKHAIRKSEHYHFILAKLLIFIQIVRTKLLNNPSNISIISYFYDIIFDLISNHPWTTQQALMIIKQSILSENKDNKALLLEKLKLVQSKSKKSLKENSIEYIMIQIIQYKAHKYILNDQFHQVENVEKKLFNVNKLKELLQQTFESHPNEHSGIQYIVSFLVDITSTQTLSQAKETLNKFWKFIFNEFVGQEFLDSNYNKNKLEEKEQETQEQSKDNNKDSKLSKKQKKKQKRLTQSQQENNKNKFDIKKFNLVLLILKRFLKDDNFNIQLLQCINQELLQFWLKQMNVNNKVLKNQAMKIQKIIEDKLGNLNKQNQVKLDDTVLIFLQNLKQKPIYKFKSNSIMAKNIFSLLSNDQIEQYLQFIKKKCNQSESMRQKIFYVNEIQVIFEYQMHNKQVEQDFINQICYFTVQQTKKNKILKIMEQEWQKQTEMDSEVEENDKDNQFSLNVEQYDNNRETLFDIFYSILQSSQNYIKTKILVNFNSNKIAINNQKNNVKLLIIKEQNTQLITIIEHIINKKTNEEFLIKYLTGIKEQINKIEKNNEEQQFQIQNLIKLQLAMFMQSLHYKDESIETLEEISIIIKKYNSENVNEKPKKKVKKEKKEENNEEDKKYVDVLTDLLISQLTKSHAFLRTIVNDCFSSFIDQVDQNCVENIVQVLVRENQEYIQDMLNDENNLEQEMEEENDE